MVRKSRSPVDPIEREIELALKPGVFIPDRACFAFTGELDEVEARLAKLTDSAPAGAVALYEAFLAGCYQKIEEVDDSSGSFGQLVEQLFCGWIKARQASGSDPEDTAARLLAWMDDDPYGFAYHLDQGAARVFDKAGLAAFVKLIRTRLAALEMPVPGESSERTQEQAHRRWTGVLRTLYLAQNNVAAYIALAQESGLTATDCHAVATLLVRRRKPEEALAWVERGISIIQKDPRGTTAGYELARLQRELLTKLGRGAEAVQSLWSEYQKAPSKYTYRELMQFAPKAERAAWHSRAIDAAQGADLSSLIELLLDAKELARLAELLGRTQDDSLVRLSHYTTEPVARKLEKTHPQLAARLWRAQGLRILNSGKSKYYDAALSNFESAMHCFVKAGQLPEWEKTVRTVRAEHHRKTGFLAGFEELVSGQGPSDKPSYLERAKMQFLARQHP